jgi:K+-transporting ATPase c subunit
VLRLIIAIVAGLVVAVVATGFAQNVLSNAANGTPSNSTIYVYGTR